MAFFNPPPKREIKVLGIGNSFTVNAFSLLDSMSDRCDKVRLVLGYATIGGCSMEPSFRVTMMSGKKYKIRCPGSEAVFASDWLLDELKEFREDGEK